MIFIGQVTKSVHLVTIHTDSAIWLSKYKINHKIIHQNNLCLGDYRNVRRYPNSMYRVQEFVDLDILDGYVRPPDLTNNNNKIVYI